MSTVGLVNPATPFAGFEQSGSGHEPEAAAPSALTETNDVFIAVRGV